jgi:hypothetical protein
MIIIIGEQAMAHQLLPGKSDISQDNGIGVADDRARVNSQHTHRTLFIDEPEFLMRERNSHNLCICSKLIKKKWRITGF